MQQSTERKPTALERLALNMLENLLRSTLGKNPQELQTLFNITLAQVNAASAAIIAIDQRLAAIEIRLGLRLPAETGAEHPRQAADDTIGRLVDSGEEPTAVRAAAAEQPGSNGTVPGGAGKPTIEIGGAA